MSTPTRFIVLVTVFVALLAALIAPRADDRLAMLRDNHKHAEIVELLEKRLASDGNDPAVLGALGRAHAELGHTGRAIALLERSLALFPEDAGTVEYLADLFLKSNQPARRREALQRSVELAPKLARIAELAGLLRQAGEQSAELALLEQAAGQLTVQSGLRLRLAQLLAQEGQKARAVGVLLRPEVTDTPPKAARADEERLLLATLLTETGRSGEAVRLGKLWIAQWREPWLAGRLLMAVAKRAPGPDARELAGAVAELHPGTRFFLAKALFEEGAREPATFLLRTWQRGNPNPSAEDLAGFLTACRTWGEPSIVWEAFAQALNSGMQPEIVARYTETIAAEFGWGALAPFWSRLPPAVLERRPLLAARLAFAEQNPALAAALLARVDVMSLRDPDQQIWADLLTAVASPEAAFSRLDELKQSGRLPASLLAQYATLGGTLGRTSEYPATQQAIPDGGS